PVSLVSNTLTVRATVDLTTSTKAVRNVTTGANVFLPGDVVEYTINLVNSGTQTATGITLTDPIPANLTFISGTAQPAASFDGTTLSWSLASLAGGSSAAFVFRASIAAAVAN